MAQRASASATPIAERTCEAPILPDEQAAPALTATPSRSSAMTCVSLETPAREKQLVLPTRGAPAP